MIIYNIRANGPYEYDKFILNFGQLYNYYADAKDEWKQSPIWNQDNTLSNMVQHNTEVWENSEGTIKNNNVLAILALMKEIMTE